MANNVLIDNLSAPLNGATTAHVDIDTGTGNLEVDRFTGAGAMLATGTLQYLEEQGAPARTLTTNDNGEAALTLKGTAGRRSWFRMPWDACGGGAYDWQIHLNPGVPADITAHSGGGNLKLNLAGMTLTHLSADTGGGNVEVVLPDNAVNLSLLAKTGAGNVTVDVGSGAHGIETVEATSGAGNVEVRVPSGTPALIHARSGLGKVIVDPQYGKVGNETYRSTDYDSAPDRVEITAHSGAGNVTVGTK